MDSSKELVRPEEQCEHWKGAEVGGE
jgi:hypothetical protein